MVSRAFLLLLLWLIALCPPASFAADIRVRVEPDPVPMDQSFQISFEAEGSVDDAPDFSPLERDFQVLSSSQSRNVTFRNGRSSSMRVWTLTVLARHAGTLTIPPIEFGSDVSPADSVTVTAAGTRPQPSRQSGEAFIEVEANPLSAYVQSQLIYTVRLFLSISPGNASLSEPVVQSGKAVIERLGEDRQYETRVMDQRFEVIERDYAIYPQQSGALTIGPVQFRGQIGGRSVFSLLDPFGPQPRQIVRQSAPVTLEIKPIPAAFTGGHWLPARNVSLIEQWSVEPPEFHAGEPITRTLTLTADGQTSSQLPELAVAAPDGFRAYPDQPSLQDSKGDKDVVATRQEKIALIPQRAGEYELPEISVPWWNTATERMEVVRVPARRVTVLPGSGVAPVDVPQPSPNVSTQAPERAEPVSVLPARSWYAKPLPWQILAALLALGWLSTLLLARRKRVVNAPPEQVQQTSGTTAAEKLLRKACDSNDPQAAKEALLQWARTYWSEDAPASIAEIARRCAPPLAAELDRLSSVLYGRNRVEWKGAALWETFSQNRPARSKDAPSEANDLEPLFRL